MRLRSPALILLLTACSLALANGAMGYALEVFDFRVWTAYVVITIVFEAWIIGRGIGFSWPKSLFISSLANAFTSFCCASGPLAAILHFGADPNPFLNTTLVLVGYGLLSFFLEAIVWLFPMLNVNEKEKGVDMALRALGAHILGIPLALAILLIPPRPYPGVEGVAQVYRGMRLRSLVRQAYGARISEKDGHFRQFKDLAELEAAFKQLDPLGDKVLCMPEYSRFATQETSRRRFEVEFNRASPDKRTWLLKIYDPGNLKRGWWFEPETLYAR